MQDYNHYVASQAQIGAKATRDEVSTSVRQIRQQMAFLG
jgi:hypothetical protein